MKPKGVVSFRLSSVFQCDMGAHMKTTIDIADPLLRKAKRLAQSEKTTLKQITEEALELLLVQRKQQTVPSYHPVIVKGDGLTSEFQNASWQQLRSAIYEAPRS